MPQTPSYCLFWAHKWWPLGDPWWLCMDTQSWAAWVQAFGSILAILGSAGIGWWLHRLQVRAERVRTVSTHLDEVRRTAGLLRFAAIKVGNMHRRMGSVAEFNTYYSEIARHDYVPQMHQGIGMLTDKDAPTASLLMLLIAAQEAFNDFYTLFQRIRFLVDEGDRVAGEKVRVTKLLSAVELAADEFDRYIDEQKALHGV